MTNTTCAAMVPACANTFENLLGGPALVQAFWNEIVDVFEEIKEDGEILLDLRTVLSTAEIDEILQYAQGAWNTKLRLIKRLPRRSKIEELFRGGDHIVVSLQHCVVQLLQAIPSVIKKRIPIRDGKLLNPKHKGYIRKLLLKLLLHERRHTVQDGQVTMELELIRFLWAIRQSKMGIDTYFTFGHEADAEGFAMAAILNPDLQSQVKTWERQALTM